MPLCDSPHTRAGQLSQSSTWLVTLQHRVFRNYRIIEFKGSEVVMQFPVLLPGAIADLFAQSTISGCLTKADRYGLMAALLDEELDSEEIGVIDRLLRAVYRGRVAIADEISTVV